MKPHAFSEPSDKTLVLFNKIKKVFENLPEVDLGKDNKGEKILVSCHMIVRALAEIFSIKYKDGYFGSGCEHSWLIPEPGVIIDPYPVATVGGSILVITKYMTPWHYLYKETPLKELNDPRFLENTQKIMEVVHKIITKLKI